MGIRGKFILVIAVIAVAVGAASYLTLQRSHNALIHQEALRIAEIVSTQVVSDRAEYTQNVVGKLVKDGTGAARDSHQKPGWIPLPAQFVSDVSRRVAARAVDLYAYRLVSLWNLNEKQGLETAFQRWAWSRLEAQDDAFAKNGSTPGPNGFAWEPVYRFESGAGRQILRYMKADPASAAACITCHNAMEQTADVAALRQRQGVAPGKSWAPHRLMGGIEVAIPVDQVAAAAAAGRNSMLTWLGAVFAGGFGVLFALIYGTIIRPVEASVTEIEGFSSKVDSVVDCSKKLLLGAEEQVSACHTARGADGGLAPGSVEFLATAANENAKSAEEAAMHCNELETSFGQLKGRLQKILGRA